MQDPSTAPIPETLQLDDVRPGKYRGWFYVIQTGLLTTALALGGVYLLSSGKLFGEEFNIMGFYVNYILPLGALAVGFVAGIGYGGAAAFTGYKLSRNMLLLIAAIQIIAYFVAQFIEFRQYDLVYEDNGQAVGFWEYFHFLTISWSWKDKNGNMGESLGMWGYAFRSLEILGFAVGGLILPGMQMSRPYCDTCRTYKKKCQLGHIRASVPVRKISKDDSVGQAAYETEQQKMMDEAGAEFDRLKELAAAGDVEGFSAHLTKLDRLDNNNSSLPIRIRIEMEHCPGCQNGKLLAMLLIGTGENTQVQLLSSSDLPAPFVSGYIGN
jgi:hypothetical protein